LKISCITALGLFHVDAPFFGDKRGVHEIDGLEQDRAEIAFDSGNGDRRSIDGGRIAKVFDGDLGCASLKYLTAETAQLLGKVDIGLKPRHLVARD